MTNSTTKSFLLHKDSLSILDQLTDQQAGKMFKAIYAYQKTGKTGDVDQLIKIALNPFLSQFSRDKESYLNSVLQGKLGNLKKYHKEIYQRVAAKELTIEEGEDLAYPDKKLLFRPPITPDQVGSLIVNDSVSDSVNDSDSVNKKDKEDKEDKEKKDKEVFQLPDFIQAKTWNDYLEMRIKAKAPNTDRAIKLIIKDLTNFENKKSGNANLSLENSIKSNWKGVFEPKTNNFNNNNSRIGF
jgi:hypothetical protein